MNDRYQGRRRLSGDLLVACVAIGALICVLATILEGAT